MDEVRVGQEPGAGPRGRGQGVDGAGMGLRQGPDASVRARLEELAARELDLLVIGGGITGAGIARDAAMRGLATGLVEMADVGAGTSSRSSRLVHGGLRYLEHFQWRLVFEALAERRVLLRIAPHLVRPLPFLLPVHRGDRVPRWKLAAGLALYGLLAAGGNVPRPRMMGKAGVLALEPNLRARGLQGGGLYYDAQCDDARLVLATLRSALAHGALAGTYLEVTALLRDAGRVAGAQVRDRLTGAEAAVRARVVVNATGPWTDRIRRLEDPDAAPLLRPTRGSHVMLRRNRIGHTHAITLTSRLDGRVMFVLPWGDFSYIGTTDTDTRDDPARVHADQADVHYLLRSVNALFPHAHLGPEDVLAAWAGLRPLLAADPALAASAVPREHRILTGPLGLLSVAGGKLTTYRRMAAETVDRAVRALGADAPARYPAPPTDTEPLPGGESASVTPFRLAATELGLPAATVTHLLRLYGTETAAVLNLARDDRRLLQPLHPEHPAIGAQAVYAARRELACRVEDVLDRRLHLNTETADQGRAAAGTVAALLGGVLGWDPDRVAEEAARFDPVAPPAAGPAGSEPG